MRSTIRFLGTAAIALTLCAPMTVSLVERAIAADAPAFVPPPNYGQIESKRIGLGGIRLHTLESEVRRLLGEPLQVQEEMRHRVLIYPDLRIVLRLHPAGDTVERIQTSHSKPATPEQIQVGDSRQKVMTTYGKPIRNRTNPMTYISGGIDFMSFEFEGDRVSKITCYVVLDR